MTLIAIMMLEVLQTFILSLIFFSIVPTDKEVKPKAKRKLNE